MIKYRELLTQRGISFSPWPSRMALFVAEGPFLVAGVMAYDTTGPYIIFEHLVTNEAFGLKERHRAVMSIGVRIMSLCRHLGKVPHMTVRSLAMKAMLGRLGLSRVRGAELMSCDYEGLEHHEEI